MSQLTRRDFLGRTAAGTAGLAGILASGVPPARGQQREISYLCWNNFAPAMDKKQLEIAQRFTKDTGIKIRIDGISHMGPQQQKLAAEIQTQAGHDLIELRMHFPWLYEPQLVDVSDVVAELEKNHGPALSSTAEAAKVKGVWRAAPMYHGLFVATYREDLFKKAGLKLPDTWEDLYIVGKELKKMGHPVGIPIAQNYDSISTAGPVAAVPMQHVRRRPRAGAPRRTDTTGAWGGHSRHETTCRAPRTRSTRRSARPASSTTSTAGQRRAPTRSSASPTSSSSPT